MSLSFFAFGPVEWDPVGPIRNRMPSRDPQRDTLPPSVRVRDMYDDPTADIDYFSPDAKERRQADNALFGKWFAENEAMLSEMWEDQRDTAREPYDDWLAALWHAQKGDFIAAA